MIVDKKVKIFVIFGLVICSCDDICVLVEVGVNLFCLNFSYGDYVDYVQCFVWVCEVEVELNYLIGVFMDLQGLKLWVGCFVVGVV